MKIAEELIKTDIETIVNYRTIEIYPTKDGWTVTKKLTKGEFEYRLGTIPSPQGYYHFPESMSWEEGYKRLKECMIQAHEKEISRLEKSLEKLRNINGP